MRESNGVVNLPSVWYRCLRVFRQTYYEAIHLRRQRGTRGDHPREGPRLSLRPWQAEYNRRRATDETTACVEAARDAGADEIIVHDCGFIRGVTPGGLTLLYDELPRGVKIVMGGAGLLSVIDETFDGVILLGTSRDGGHTERRHGAHLQLRGDR